MKRTAMQYVILSLKCAADLIPVAGTLLQEGLDWVKVWADEKLPEDITEILSGDDLDKLNIPAGNHPMVRAAVKDMLNAMDDATDYGFDPRKAAGVAIQNLVGEYQYSDKELAYIRTGFCHAIRHVLLKMKDDPDFWLQHMEDFEEIEKKVEEFSSELTKVCRRVERLEVIVEDHEGRITTLEQGKTAPAIKPDQAATYRNRWKSVFFLEEDLKHSPVKLSALYLNPPYQLEGEEDDRFDLHDLLEQYLSGTAERNMLVIRGQPGGGKSTLISYILNKCECRRVIRVYQLKELDVEWEGKTPLGVADALLKALNLENNKDGLKNSVLILDGFDEVAVGKWRKDILDALYREWCEQIEDFTLLLTCRVNALPWITGNDWDYITLSPWNKEQIETFAENYWKVREKRPEDGETLLKRFVKRKNIMGLPLVLYMALALDLKAEKAASVTDVYDEIFSLERGRIWHRSYSPGGESEESYKNELYALSKKAAWNMWVNNPGKAVIKGTELEKEAKLILGENREGELTELLRRFSMVRHSEGRAETEFIHRSIYEYFAAMTIFDAVRDYLQDETVISDEVTAELAELMSVRVLAEDIEGHLKKLVENSERADKCKEAWQKWFGQRLENGMQPSGADVGGLTWIDQEMKCFQNYIKLLRPILGQNTEKKYCKLWRDDDEYTMAFMGRYIRYTTSSIGARDLSRLDLSHMDLFGVNLYLSNLSSTNLRSADLRDANLFGVDLRGADLHDADLRGTYLESTIISESMLKFMRHDLVIMKKTILLNDDLTPARLLTDEQKFILRYHGIPILDN